MLKTVSVAGERQGRRPTRRLTLFVTFKFIFFFLKERGLKPI